MKHRKTNIKNLYRIENRRKCQWEIRKKYKSVSAALEKVELVISRHLIAGDSIAR